MEPLNQVEVRVLGALIEKEISTPDYYPMTLNGLTNACNQKSNRDPVVAFDEKTVFRALETLREERHLVRVVSGADMRVPKYYHRLAEVLEIDRPQLALLCELMLRGPQTIGELRNRCGRLHSFANLEAVDATLTLLEQHPQGPLVKQLPRQPGRKEARHAHLLAGEPPIEDTPSEAPREPAALAVDAENQRIAKLEEQVENLQAELVELRQIFDDFRKQFD